MGFWPWSSNEGSKTQNDSSEVFQNFSSKIVRIVCKTHDDGQYRCTKVTQSSDPSHPGYEEVGSHEQEVDLEKEFNEMSENFNRGFSLFGQGLFSHFENDLERIFNKDPYERSYPSHRRNDQYSYRPKEKDQDSNIYDI